MKEIRLPLLAVEQINDSELLVSITRCLVGTYVGEFNDYVGYLELY